MVLVPGSRQPTEGGGRIREGGGGERAGTVVMTHRAIPNLLSAPRNKEGLVRRKKTNPAIRFFWVTEANYGVGITEGKNLSITEPRRSFDKNCKSETWW